VLAGYPALRRQELVLIALNVMTLLGLLAIHLIFREYMEELAGWPVPVLLGLRVVQQTGEALWLWQRRAPLSARGTWWYAHASLWIHVAFAFLLTSVSETDEAHFVVLLLLPLLAACFRYPLPGVMTVAFVSSTLLFIELWTFYLINAGEAPSHEPMEHYYELATMVLIYPVVGLVVWLLVQRMRLDAQRLEHTVQALEETRDALVEKEKLAAVGRLASAVAHEIRNPVAMITSALETAGKPDSGQQVRDEFCNIAATEAARLERVTTDFLSYARSKPPEKTVTPVDTTLQYIADLMRPRLGSSDISIEITCASGLKESFDAFQMHQALLNLTLNALDHTPPHDQITLGARITDTALEMYVENTGDPVPEDQVEAIFEPFYTTRNTGTGLGLPISARIAEAHGGRLELTRNDTGSVRFTMRIPTEKRGA
jgi:signal transduction histidine kinase